MTMKNFQQIISLAIADVLSCHAYDTINPAVMTILGSLKQHPPTRPTPFLSFKLAGYSYGNRLSPENFPRNLHWTSLMYWRKNLYAVSSLCRRLLPCSENLGLRRWSSLLRDIACAAVFISRNSKLGFSFINYKYIKKNINEKNGFLIIYDIGWQLD